MFRSCLNGGSRKPRWHFFWNTSCTGRAYLKELKPFKEVPEIESLEFENICVNGQNSTSVVTSNGIKIEANYMIIGSNTRTSGWYSEDAIIDLLDETLLHEFVHRQRDSDPVFKQSTDEFLKFRYHRLQNDYLNASDRVEESINEEAARIAAISGLSDKKRNEMIFEYSKNQMNRFRDWMISNKIPVNAGMASRNGIWDKDKSSELKPGEFILKNTPEFNDGKPTQFKFIDWARAIPRNATGLASVQTLDSYSLYNEEEYVAVGLAMYRYDRASANKSFSKEELEWLERNWESGYLHK